MAIGFQSSLRPITPWTWRVGARLTELLRHPQGATVEQIMQLTGWDRQRAGWFRNYRGSDGERCGRVVVAANPNLNPGYLDIPTALADTIAANGSALSPTAVYDSGTGNVYLVATNGVVWGSSAVWGTSAVLGHKRGVGYHRS